MKARIVFHDGTWFIGRRVTFFDILSSQMKETQGTYHWIVEDVGTMNLGIRQVDKGDRVPVPINSMKFCVIAEEFYEDGTTKDNKLPF